MNCKASNNVRCEDGSSIVETTIALAILLFIIASLLPNVETVVITWYDRSAKFDYARLNVERVAAGLAPCPSSDCPDPQIFVTSLDSLTGDRNTNITISDSAGTGRHVSLKIFKRLKSAP